jgi:hypothetical protein
MRKCRLVINIKSIVTLPYDEDEYESIDNFVETIEQGYPPIWIEQAIKTGLSFKEIEVEKIQIIGGEPQPEEELNFDQ